MTDPTDAIRERALSLGFHRVGIARAGPLEVDHERYREWLSAGRHGTMSWLGEDIDARRDVDHPGILEGARSVVVCAMGYLRADDRGPITGARVARYARGRDYHNFFRRRLRKLARWMRSEHGAQARPMVDTAPVLERAWAQRAGVGFVGKNGCIIAPGLGSFVLLGEVVTDLALRPDVPMEPRCGSCTLCLDACPTRAFVGPWVLDARRCVSYLTIESEEAPAQELRTAMGDRVFGCDDCQDVCPYNRTGAPPEESTRDFLPDPRWDGISVGDILALGSERFTELAEGSPLARPGRHGLARNAAVVLGNTGGRRHLPLLERSASTDPHPAVRECSTWAIARIREREGA